MLPLLEALSYEKRQVTLLGDFNMNGHNNTNRKVTQFDHEICAGLLISFIWQKAVNRAILTKNLKKIKRAPKYRALRSIVNGKPSNKCQP